MRDDVLFSIKLGTALVARGNKIATVICETVEEGMHYMVLRKRFGVNVVHGIIDSDVARKANSGFDDQALLMVVEDIEGRLRGEDNEDLERYMEHVVWKVGKECIDLKFPLMDYAYNVDKCCSSYVHICLLFGEYGEHSVFAHVDIDGELVNLVGQLEMIVRKELDTRHDHKKALW